MGNWDVVKEIGEYINIVLDDGAYPPERAHSGDAGLDIRTPVKAVLKAHGSVVINTGVHVEIPYGYVGELESKSGLNCKYSVVSCGGTIDNGYSGAMVVKLYNHGDEDYVFEKGDKIIQLVVYPVWLPKVRIVDALPDSDRGSNGFGSSGR